MIYLFITYVLLFINRMYKNSYKSHTIIYKYKEVKNEFLSLIYQTRVFDKSNVSHSKCFDFTPIGFKIQYLQYFNTFFRYVACNNASSQMLHHAYY